MLSPSNAIEGFHIPLIYVVLLAYYEPLSALNGALIVHLWPQHYYALNAMIPESDPAAAISPATHMVLMQVAGLYVAWGLSEAIIFHRCKDMGTWKIFIASLLLSDLGILWSVHPLGWEAYWRLDRWNYIAGANFALCYSFFVLRVCFLLGVGIRRTSVVKKGT